MPQGSGLGVATHPVAQLNNRIIPSLNSLQHPHRPRPSRTQYFHTIYDGEGKRVKKVTNSETTVFVYSGGKLIAEYSTNVAPIEEAKVAYTTTDHLGTPRVITNQFGVVVSRRDFLPFGEEIHTGVGARSTTLDYGSQEDTVRQKFTGYQKDTETSLDFAEARMYENRFGRFTAVDPLLASGKSANPQTFNRYVYVSGNPLSRTDPSGLIWLEKNGQHYWVDDKFYKSKEGQKMYKGFNISNGWEYKLSAVGKGMEQYGHLIGSIVQNDPEGAKKLLFVRQDDVPSLSESSTNRETMPSLTEMMLFQSGTVSPSVAGGNDLLGPAYLLTRRLEESTGQDMLPDYIQLELNAGGEVSGILTRFGDFHGCAGLNTDLALNLFVNPARSVIEGRTKFAASANITANKILGLGHRGRIDTNRYINGIALTANAGRGFFGQAQINSTFRPAIGIGIGIGSGVSGGATICRPVNFALTDGQRIF